MRKLNNNTALLQKKNNEDKLKLRSFNSQLHSALSVVGYHDRGQEIGKYCTLPEPIRLQDSQDTARSRSKKLIKSVTVFAERHGMSVRDYLKQYTTNFYSF